MSEERLGIALSATNDGLWDWTSSSSRDFVSPQYYRMFGYEPGEFVPSHEFWRSQVHPDDLERVLRHVEESLSSGKIRVNDEYRMKNKNGDYIWILSKSQVVAFDENNNGSRIIGTLRDLTERKKAEDQLKFSLSLLNASLESTADGILVVNCAGQIVRWNQKFVELWNVPVDLLITEIKDPVLAYVVKQMADPPAFLDKVTYLYEHPEKSSEDFLELADGRYFERYSQPQKINDEIVGRVWSFRDVTKRKLAEDGLRESKQRFENIIDKLQKKIIFFTHTLNGEVIYLSKGARAIGSIDPETVIGKRWEEVANWTPKSLEFGMEQLKKLMSNHDTHVEHELSYIHTDGKEHHLAVYEYVVFSSERNELVVEGVVIDITDQKEKDSELRTLTRAIENAPVTVVITNMLGEIVYSNPQFSKVTGYTREEAIGQNPRVLKSGKHSDEFYKDMWETLVSGNTWSGEIINKKKDGTLYWESASISPIVDQGGTVTNYVAVKEDISTKKDLEQIKDDVERIMRHDLKTPLNAIIGLPQILEMDGNLTTEQKEMIAAIKNSGERMLFMIDSSLDIFKMETGKYEFRPKLVNALAVLDHLAGHCRSKLSAKNQSLRVIVDGNVPPPGEGFMLESEDNLLYSLFSNLIINALEASPDNEEVVVSFLSSRPIIISICNKGAVPVDVREHFFEKYKTFGKRSGTGLGTYSAKLIANTMGYAITMSASDEENSTCITISIPSLN